MNKRWAIATALVLLLALMPWGGAVAQGPQPYLVKDIYPGSDGSSPGGFTEFGGRVFFQANDGTHGAELWLSDGTEADTVMLVDINPGTGWSSPWGFTEFDGQLFFRAGDGAYGTELWVSDGTPEGTAMLKDIYPGSSSSLRNPPSLTEFGGELFFLAEDATHGIELWVSDGTPGGTVMLKDINPGPDDSWPNGFTEFGGQLFFWATDATHGRELWVSDGTPEGTVMLVDIYPGSSGSDPCNFTESGGQLFFPADDGAHGIELWVSDGTSEGTVMLKDIYPGSSSSHDEYPPPMIEFGGRLFFRAEDGTHGIEPWVSDGTSEGTVMLKDLYPGSGSSYAYVRGFEFDGQLFFNARDDTHGRELWISDGTPEGTVMLMDIYPGPDDSYPVEFTELDGKLFFSAGNDTHGVEPWALSTSSDLALTKATSHLVAAPGQTITYTLVYSNRGPLAVSGVLITDVLPTTLIQVGYTYSGTVITPTEAVSYTWHVADLKPGDGGAITVTGLISPDLSGVFDLANRAEIASSEYAFVDAEPANNASAVTVTVDGLPPLAPTLQSPAHGTIVSSTTSKLMWLASPSSDVAGYLLDWNGATMDVGNVTHYTTTMGADGTYTWTVAAYDALRNTSSFTDVWTLSLDTAPPEVLATLPVSGTEDVEIDAPVMITFSEIIDTDSFIYALAPDPGGRAENWDGARMVVTLSHADFEAGTLYTVTVTSAADLAGNPLSAAPHTCRFTTQVAYTYIYLPLVTRNQS